MHGKSTNDYYKENNKQTTIIFIFRIIDQPCKKTFKKILKIFAR